MNILKPLVFFLWISICAPKLYAQEITSFAGTWSMEYYQDDKRITTKDLKELFAKNQEVMGHWKKRKVNLTFAYSSLSIGYGFAFWGGTRLGQDKNSLPQLAGTLGFTTISVIFMTLANQNRKKAILMYNKQFDKQTSLRLVPTSNANGVGLALKF